MPASTSHILCPTDFSEGSRRALTHAAALARRTGAHLTVAHAWSPGAPGTLFGDAGAAALVHADQRDTEVERLNASVASLRAQGFKLATVALEGPPVPALLAFMDDEDVDLLVMGTHGRTGFERLVLGSVTEKMLRKAACPVLTIPPGSPGEPSIPARVLCAVDHLQPNDPTVAAAVWWAGQGAGRLTVLHVVEPLRPPPGLGEFDATPYTDRLSTEWLEALRGCVGPAVRSTIEVHERVAIGKPSQTIVDTAAQVMADVVVMGVHGRGALDRLLLGSTTHYVVKHARCPVLTVRVPLD